MTSRDLKIEKDFSRRWVNMIFEDKNETSEEL